MTDLDLVVRGADIVRPGVDAPFAGDIGIRAGRVEAVGGHLEAGADVPTVDARGLLAFPGVIDSHQHWGIYQPLEEDTVSESRACAQGGVTTGLTYIRTGQYYLNRSGPYAEFLPEVLRRTGDRAYVDHGLHVAPMMASHIDEIPDLIRRFGVTSFKIFMFYGSHGLHGRSSQQSDFLMIPEDEAYDYAHFEFVMRGIQKAREQLPTEVAAAVSLSLHCETAEIMRAYSRIVEERGELSGLSAYHASRPPHSEGLAVTIAAYLAHETELPNINLLHLSSRKAMDAALRMAEAFPHIDFRREVTVGHLLLDIDSPTSVAGKVNPPIRPREDVDALWDAVLAGHVDWIVSDHACCRAEQKFGDDPGDIFAARSGFGGTEYLLPGVYTEGRRRGLSLGRMAELLSANPSRRYGLDTKGDLAPGFDADIVLFDPHAPVTVRAAASESAQEYTPFEGMQLDGQVRHVFLRGHHIVRDGDIVGPPRGRYIHRPAHNKDR